MKRKVALVTGGSKGIGRAVALHLAKQETDVAITWFRDRESAEKTTAELEELGARVHCTRAFLSEADTPERIVRETRETLGEPDLLVSNAASGVQRPLDKIERSHWDWTVDTNAVAFLRLAQECTALTAGVALTSLGSTRVLPNYGIVGVSKAALETLVRYLAVERAPGCRFNSVSAGVVDTDSLKKFPDRQRLLDESQSRTPAGRLATPEDVAKVVCFLLSDEASMITGQTIVVDGGFSLVA